MEPKQLQNALTRCFPALDFCAAYGSGVFKQKNHDASTSMIDLLFAVDDPLTWHQANLQHNASHYSFLKHFGATSIASIQEKYGAAVYYNTLVPLEIEGCGTRLIKYGVVSCKSLCHDLTTWNWLYLSGRMQKPVHLLKTTKEINAASSANLQSALNYALLVLPATFTEEQLYMKIAGISYSGDFRMQFGENPKKVRNIVQGQFATIRQMYLDKIKASDFVTFKNCASATTTSSSSSPIKMIGGCASGGVLLTSRKDLEAQLTLIHSLPSQVHHQLDQLRCPSSKYEEMIRTDGLRKKLHRAVSRIVKKSSRTQSIKGIVTAGMVKSVQYVGQKLERTYWKRLIK